MSRTAWELMAAEARRAALAAGELVDLGGRIAPVRELPFIYATRAAYASLTADATAEAVAGNFNDLGIGIERARTTIPSHDPVRVVRCCTHRKLPPRIGEHRWLILLAFLSIDEGWIMCAANELS